MFQPKGEVQNPWNEGRLTRKMKNKNRTTDTFKWPLEQSTIQGLSVKVDDFL